MRMTRMTRVCADQTRQICLGLIRDIRVIRVRYCGPLSARESSIPDASGLLLLRLLALDLLELADPDVAETHRVAVILQVQRGFRWVGGVLGGVVVVGSDLVTV